MNHQHEQRHHTASFLFLAIFMVFTSADVFFRGDSYAKEGDAKFQKPWVETPELLAHGKTLYEQQCVSCHGPVGKGDGVAAPALNPRPRNFTVDTGWKNGRKPSQIFKTLKNGIPGSSMGSYSVLPAVDRWALSHYVRKLGPGGPGDSPQDLAAIGVDPTKEGVEEKVVGTISVEAAMARLAEPTRTGRVEVVRGTPVIAGDVENVGQALYTQHCASCHGHQGEGAKVKALVDTDSLAKAGAMETAERFNRVVVDGLPGNLMPGNGQLTGRQLNELYRHARSLSGR